jgi:hypothetical protein
MYIDETHKEQLLPTTFSRAFCTSAIINTSWNSRLTFILSSLSREGRLNQSLDPEIPPVTYIYFKSGV